MGANLKEVRDRIKSVQGTQQITKAMKLVAAAKLRRAQDSITQLRPYSDKLDEMMRNILTNLGSDVSSSYGEERNVENACVVVITSNKGLCGAFNTNIIKQAVAVIDNKYAAQRKSGNLAILCIGKKGAEYFKKYYSDCNIMTDYTNLFTDLSFDNVSKVSRRLLMSFEDGKFDSIDVAYGRFKNAAVQIPTLEQYLPVKKVEADPAHKTSVDYIFEPDKASLLNHLIPSILQTQFQKFLLDTHASEHGARMTAMEQATDNANELLNDLIIMYNKARQETITNEILEIVGGAAALEG